MTIGNRKAPPAVAGPGSGQTIVSGLQAEYSASPAQRLLPLLRNVHRTAKGWRADCPNPSHEGRGSLSITEDAGLLLVHCFGCHDTHGLLAAVGLELADLYPERIKDPSPEARHRAREAAKRNGWAAALRVLDDEAQVVLLAGCDVASGIRLDADDHIRLITALDRITNARTVLA